MSTSFNKYILTTQLGKSPICETSMGYEQSQPEQHVVIKIYDTASLSLSSDSKDFAGQVNLFKRLTHPALVPVLDIGIEHEQLYVVRAYLPHSSLHRRLETKLPQLPGVAEAVQICTRVGQALTYIHQEGIVHGNIKPENILFDNMGRAMLADLSLAGLIDHEQSGYKSDLWAVRYMAPEQFIGTVSEKGDQYALGCLLYELLTGRVPFEAEEPYQLWLKHATELPVAPAQLVTDLPQPLEAAVLKAMEKDPADRYEDIAAFLEIIKSVTLPQIEKNTHNSKAVTAPLSESLAAMQGEAPVTPALHDSAKDLSDPETKSDTNHAPLTTIQLADVYPDAFPLEEMSPDAFLLEGPKSDTKGTAVISKPEHTGSIPAFPFPRVRPSSDSALTPSSLSQASQKPTSSPAQSSSSATPTRHLATSSPSATPTSRLAAVVPPATPAKSALAVNHPASASLPANRPLTLSSAKRGRPADDHASITQKVAAMRVIALPRRRTLSKRAVFLALAVAMLVLCGSLFAFTLFSPKKALSTPTAQSTSHIAFSTTTSIESNATIKPTATSIPSFHPTSGPTVHPTTQPGTNISYPPTNSTFMGTGSGPTNTGGQKSVSTPTPQPVHTTQPTPTPTPTPAPTAPPPPELPTVMTLNYQEFNGVTNLTNEGTVDWSQWCESSAVGFNHKTGGSQIGNYSVFGNSTASCDTASYSNRFIWSNGTPVGGGSVASGIMVSGTGNGFSITLPVTNTLRTLKLYVGAVAGQGRLTAVLGWATQSDNSLSTLGHDNAVYTIQYRSSVSDTLTVSFWTWAATSSAPGSVILEAATLQ